MLLNNVIKKPSTNKVSINPHAMLAALNKQKPTFQEPPPMSKEVIDETIQEINETAHELEEAFDEPIQTPQTTNPQVNQTPKKRAKPVYHPTDPTLIWDGRTKKWIKRRLRRKEGDPLPPRGRPVAPPESTPKTTTSTLFNYSFTSHPNQNNPNEDVTLLCSIGWLNSGDFVIMEPFDRVYRVGMIVYHAEQEYAEIYDTVNCKKYNDMNEWRQCITPELKNITSFYPVVGPPSLSTTYDQIFVNKFHATFREVLNYAHLSKRQMRENKRDEHMTPDEAIKLMEEANVQYRNHVLMSPPTSLFHNTNACALQEMSKQLESYRVALCIAMSNSYTAQLQETANFHRVHNTPYKINEWGSMPQLLFNMVSQRPNNHLQSSAELLDSAVQILISDYHFRNANQRMPYSNSTRNSILSPYKAKEFDPIWASCNKK